MPPRRVGGWIWLSGLAFLVLWIGQASAETVRFHLDWVPNGRHLFAYAALGKGFYKEAGLDVTILRGAGSPDAIKKVAAGQAEYGVADMTAIITGRARDVQVREIGMMNPKGFIEIAFLATSGIKSLKDLSGKTACDSPTGHITIFPAFADLHGIKDWKLIHIDPAVKTASLIAARCDFIVTTVNLTAVAREVAKKEGKEVRSMLWSDHGLDLYGVALFSTDETLAKSADQVRRLVQATQKGVAWALENPAEGSKIFVQHNPTATEKIILLQWEVMVPHTVTPDVRERGIGWVDAKKMDLNIEILTKYMKLPKRVPTASVFTNEFLGPIFPPKEIKGM